MKVIHSSIFRAVCAIIVGVLLIQYREQTVTWITVAIGVLFFLSGVISLASYWAAKRNAEKMQGQILSDSNGKPIMGMLPKFPLVSVGSLILGLLLALMPQVFIAWLMFILAFILILGALTQFVNLASAAKMGRVGILSGSSLQSFFCWVCSPSSSLQPSPLPLFSSSVGVCSSME